MVVGKRWLNYLLMPLATFVDKRCIESRSNKDRFHFASVHVNMWIGVSIAFSMISSIWLMHVICSDVIVNKELLHQRFHKDVSTFDAIYEALRDEYFLLSVYGLFFCFTHMTFSCLAIMTRLPVFYMPAQVLMYIFAFYYAFQIGHIWIVRCVQVMDMVYYMAREGNAPRKHILKFDVLKGNFTMYLECLANFPILLAVLAFILLIERCMQYLHHEEFFLDYKSFMNIGTPLPSPQRDVELECTNLPGWQSEYCPRSATYYSFDQHLFNTCDF